MQEELLKRINPLVVIDMNKKDSESTKKKKKKKKKSGNGSGEKEKVAQCRYLTK